MGLGRALGLSAKRAGSAGATTERKVAEGSREGYSSSNTAVIASEDY